MPRRSLALLSLLGFLTVGFASVATSAGCAESTPPATAPLAGTTTPPTPAPTPTPAPATAPTAGDGPAETTYNVTPAMLEGKDKAAEFPADLPWLNTDKPLTLEQFRGKFVLLDFWTFCCINCMHVIPELKQLEQKYPDDLVVIGVHSAKFTNEKTTTQIRKAILRYEVHHPVVNDKDMAIWETYGIQSWPTLVLINPEGKIVGAESGENNEAIFDAILKKGVKYFAAKGTLKPGPLEIKLEARAADRMLAFPGKIIAVPGTTAAPAVGDVPAMAATPDRLIVSDTNNNRILILNPAGKILETIGAGPAQPAGHADGDFDHATFQHPQGVALDGTTLYIADTENHLIRAADLVKRTVTTVLGTGEKADHFNRPGTGTACPINSPWDLGVDSSNLYIAMAGFHQLWVMDLKTGVAKPYAGSGHENILDSTRLNASLAQPSGLTIHADTLYWDNSETSSIRTAPISAINASPVSTIVGKGLFDFGDVDGSAAVARLQHPLGIVWHDGLLYVADTYNDKIKIVDPLKRTSTTFAGTGKPGDVDGAAAEAQFNEPGGLAVLGDTLYIADTNNSLIRTLDLKTKQVGTLALAK